MAGGKILVLLATICLAYAEVKLITEPKPGEEYVFLQTSGAGSRPIERKDKASEGERVFETAHKLPPSVTYALNHADAESKTTKPKKREAIPGDAPAPAPAGAIKLDPLKLIEKYKTVLKTSSTTTSRPRSSATRSSTTRSSTTRKIVRGAKRTKKEAREFVAATSPRPVLTTGAAVSKIVDEDVPLVASGSEKQRSRIQIKKGPNGQEYEYEYVYYYYDDEDEKKDSKVSNAHDGPARNEITQKPSRSRGTTVAPPEAAVNEVLPTSRGRSRGRQLSDEEVGEERLPANTRFPPRSRNLNTTPLPDEEDSEPKGKGRTRGKPNDVASETDSVSDETQGSRGRTRANVRRPSLDLVDNASFNTHSSGSEPPSGSGPSFPSDLPAGPVRFLGATPNERSDLVNDAAEKSDVKTEDFASTDSAANDEATTMMSPMDKVALDLYAILQGTQRLAGEDESNTELDTTGPDAETTTLEATTEEATTEATTPSTTTTTTTTTTPAPTTTSAPETGFGRGRYRNRGTGGNKKSTQATATTEAPQQETKPKSRFERPRFGSRPRPGGRTTVAPVEEEIHKEESKPVSSGSKTRSRFGGPRTRHTTAAPSDSTNSEDSSASSSAPARPSLRPRPTFNLRTRTRTTAPPSEEESSADGEAAPSTTVRSRPRVASPSGSVRPLRPGPRINLGGRGRPGATTPSTEATVESSTSEDEEISKTEDTEEKEAEPAPPADNNPLNRLRNRQRPNLQVKPKAAASAPVQVRRVNPLLARRKPGGAEPTSEVPQESPSTEAAVAEEIEDTEAPAASSSTTTEEPRGLNKLLAGRRRLANRQPGTLA